MMSPNADMRNIASASSQFAKAFPSLPSLPKLLSRLSGIPRPYSALIPSKDHKEAYLDILAWLMRGAWVTQLRTFAWVRVPPFIKRSVLDDASVDAYPNEHLAKSTRKDSSPSTETSNAQDLNASQDTEGPSIIPTPPPSTPSTSLHPRYLLALSSHILSTQGQESKEAWDKCVKYFDGKHALESISVREGWKRKRVSELTSGWEGEGWLVRGRHW